MVQATAASKDVNVHPSVLTFAREGNASPAEEAGAPPHQHRHLDSHSLFWDDLNQPKFLGLITAFYLGLRLVIYPTTLIKTRQQAHVPLPGVKEGDGVKKSIFNVFKHTWKVGGPLAVYQGFTWNIIGLPVDPLYIGSMEYSRQVLHRYLRQHPGTISDKYSDLFVTLTAGGAAAVVQQTVMVPIDIVTQRLMIQPTIPKEQLTAAAATVAADTSAALHLATASSASSFASSSTSTPPKPHRTPMQIVREVMRQDGLRGLYKGYAMTLGAVVPFSALQWALYWQVQSTFMTYLKNHPPLPPPHRPAPQHGEDEYSSDWREMATAPASAAIAATLASLATQPFDTLKTRLQVQKKRTPISETFGRLMKEKGTWGLMSGSMARVLTMMPSAVLSMTAYEACKRRSVKDDAVGDLR